MKPLATYEDGHLIVAAVRVLLHGKKHPPTPEDIAQLLGLSREWVGVLITSLTEQGVLLTVDSAFTTRVEIKDHVKLESLIRARDDSGLKDELSEFSQRRRRQDEELGRLFESGDALKKKEEKLDKLASDFKGFRPKPPKSSPLFKDPPPEE